MFRRGDPSASPIAMKSPVLPGAAHVPRMGAARWSARAPSSLGKPPLANTTPRRARTTSCPSWWRATTPTTAPPLTSAPRPAPDDHAPHPVLGEDAPAVGDDAAGALADHLVGAGRLPVGGDRPVG